MEMREGESQGKSALAGAGHAPRRRGQLGAFEHFQSATPQGDTDTNNAHKTRNLATYALMQRTMKTAWKNNKVGPRGLSSHCHVKVDLNDRDTKAAGTTNPLRWMPYCVQYEVEVHGDERR